MYCKRERKKTSSIPGSEKVGLAKDGRLIKKAICQDCGSIKSQFIRSDGACCEDCAKHGKGIMSTIGDTAAEAFIQHGILGWLKKVWKLEDMRHRKQ